MGACTILCLIGYGIAVWRDEKEHQVPRILSYFVCGGALAEFFIKCRKEPCCWSSIIVSIGFFAMICIFCKKGLLGKADVYMVFSMLLLMSTRGEGMNVLFGEALFFTLAFAGAGIRMLLFRTEERACPFIAHLFAAFLCSRFLIL